MPQPVEQMGAGRVCAIMVAQEVVEKPVIEGLLICAQNVERGEALYRNLSSRYDQSTQAQTCRRLAARTGMIIKAWQKDPDVLPPTHEDFGVDIVPRARDLNVARRFATVHWGLRELDELPSHLSDAAHYLRVARLGIPELLRRHRPELDNQSSLRNKSLIQLGYIDLILGRVCVPGQLEHNRGRQGNGSGGTYGRWF